MLRYFVPAFLLAMLLASFSPCARSEVLADNGFRPRPDGFGFENWGGKTYPNSQLTPDDAYFLFGDQACARRKDQSCVPTPGARLWIDEMNRSTEGGHCEGMAVLSASFFAGQESVSDYGASEAFLLKPNNDVLMRTISTYFTTQALEPVQSVSGASRSWSLQKIVDYLVTAFKARSDFPTLGIYGDDGGHALTPFSVESVAPGRYHINVYDNNYPGAEKFIDVDVAKDRWSYGAAALNPREDPSPWQGSAGSMEVTPLYVRYEPLKCPFCAAPPPAKPATPKPKPGAPVVRPGPARKPGVVSDSYSVVTPNRCSQVRATGKKNKKQIRMSANKLDNQIAGASMRPLRGSRGCSIILPHGEEYDVQLVYDGRPSRQPGSSLSIFGSGKAWSVENVVLRPGTIETFSVSSKKFTYTAGGKQSPTLRVADDTDSRNGYYEVSGFEINQGFEFSANEDASGRTTFSDNDPSIDTWDVKAEVVGEDETRNYDFNDVSVGDDGQALFDINEAGELDMDVDSDSDGQGDSVDTDDDNDGIPDKDDADDNNDGTPDSAAADNDSNHDAGSDNDASDDAAGDAGGEDAADTTDESAPADDAENSDTSDGADDAEAADEADDSDTADEATDSDTADEATDSDTADEATDSDTADEATDSDTADEATDSDTADEATDSDTADEAADSDTADEAADADTADEVDDSDTADEAADSDTADEAADADTADEVDDSDTSDQADDSNSGDDSGERP
jgi:hypothetical protein